MKEEDIRPEKLLKKGKFYLKEDIKYLIKNKNKFVKVACPACKKNNYKRFLNKNSFNYVICKSCETFYMSPRPSEDLLKKFYKNSKNGKFWHKYMFPLTEKKRAQKIFKPRVEQIINLAKKQKLKKPNIIDIGAGFGTFCNEAKKSKFFNNIFALEPSDAGAKSCQKRKIKTLHMPVESMKKQKFKFNLITSFEVIEHLYSIDSYIKSIKKICDKDTLLIITCPNGKGFDVQYLLKDSMTIDHEHLNYFNTESIKIAFKRLGLKVIDIFTPGKLDLDLVVNFYKNQKLKTTGNSFFDDLIFSNNELKKNNFQKFLIQNNLSSNMWVVAKVK